MKWLILLLLSVAVYGESQATLFWNPNPYEPGVAGYKVYYGIESRHYTEIVDVGNQTFLDMNGLVVGASYFCNVTAYNSEGPEGPFGEEFVFTYIPVFNINQFGIDGNIITLGIDGMVGTSLNVYASSNLVDWELIDTVINNNGVITVTDPAQGVRFYRVSFAFGDLKIYSFEKSGDIITLGIEGGRGESLKVYASNDLEIWELVDTLVNTNGIFVISDPLALVEPRRFYRLRR